MYTFYGLPKIRNPNPNPNPNTGTVRANSKHISMSCATDELRIKSGMLIVGLGGNNGVTLIAGKIANRDGLSWEGAPPAERMHANLLGCITQLGGQCGFKDDYPLAKFADAVIGGWDIRPTPLGSALYNSRILDYDLVRQVQPEMDKICIMPGVWDPDFIGESQHSTAMHCVDPSLGALDKLDILRHNIRTFVSENNINGHTTVIWSASVERYSERDFQTMEELMEAIKSNDSEVSPSILYATAALLEGCSFVNGGSQNTLCRGLSTLADEKQAYCLGTDFKAGQTKFKTAAVEYIRTMGMKPVVIASSNHLGNNDMYNLTSKKTLGAKMRVKGDIFGPWDEDIDHKVSVMYTPRIGDEKRDIVEYMSLGFMGCTHTMFTYTRAMDSALCVPLMIDAATWCDYFSRCGITAHFVAAATAYLFKVPEGGAIGTDPGFFHQMGKLKDVLAKTTGVVTETAPPVNDAGRTTESIMTSNLRGSGVLCIGVGCLDMELCGLSKAETRDTISLFNEIKCIPGGSCPQVAISLAEIGMDRVIAVTKLGKDAYGDALVSKMQKAGVDCRHIIRSGDVQTATAVLPIYGHGDRDCFACLGANLEFSLTDAQRVIYSIEKESGNQPLAAIHFGYPHFLPKLQGDDLGTFLCRARSALGQPLISMDVNGADNSSIGTEKHMEILGPSLVFVDVLHANLSEAEAISGIRGDVCAAAKWFLEKGVGLVTITMGEAGAYASYSSENCKISPALADQVKGIIVGLTWKKEQLTLKQVLKMGLLTGVHRADSSLRNKLPKASAEELIANAQTHI